MEEKQRKIQWNKSHTNAVQLLTVGALTGVFVGTLITLYQLLMTVAEEYAHGAYHVVREKPWFIPVLLVALAMGAFLIGVIANVSTMVRGCGVPQVEGATRGAIRFRWLRDTTAMCASTLIGVFLGLSIGSEGPSMFIGAGLGDGVGKLTRRNEMIRRYQMTGGACTGLAVVSNAPLTGIIFAFEEAHKRFTPEVFICSFVSVICGMLVRWGIFTLAGMPITPSFQTYVFQDLSIVHYPLIILSACVCGAMGVLLCKLCISLHKGFGKIYPNNAKRGLFIRIAVAVFVGGIASLIASGVMGGGHELVNGLGTQAGTKPVGVERVFGLPIVWSLLIIFALKMLCTGVNVGTGLPCGIFVPVIAMGACIGGMLNALYARFGVGAQYADLITMICMASFFVAVVKAPLTAIIMICEFTGSITTLLPVIIAVAIGYAISDLCRTDGIYETLLETYEEEYDVHIHKVKKIFAVTVGKHSLADGREISEVLWPDGTWVQEILRGEETFVPDRDTQLLAGDVLKIECKTADEKHTLSDLQGITK